MVSLLTLVAAQSLCGQNGGTLVGAGYERPPLQLRVAPGQIVRLRVAGLAPLSGKGRFRQDATTMPLPTTLAGLSVSVSQVFLERPTTTLTARLLSIEQTPLCLPAFPSSASVLTDLPALLLPDCYLTTLTVQMPNELVPFDFIRFFNGPADTQIVVTQNGKPSLPFSIVVVQSSVHVLTACDSDELALECTPAVTHGDGTPVSRASPAQAGETIVVYAWGLGQTIPGVETGEQTPEAAPILSLPNIYLEFDFRPNASPSATYTVPSFGATLPVFVGLTPGQVGMYQINIQLPDTFPTVRSCGGNILSNLTINIGPSSIAGAPICVTASP